jgi:hypothetical protein
MASRTPSERAPRTARASFAREARGVGRARDGEPDATRPAKRHGWRGAGAWTRPAREARGRATDGEPDAFRARATDGARDLSLRVHPPLVLPKPHSPTPPHHPPPRPDRPLVSRHPTPPRQPSGARSAPCGASHGWRAGCDPARQAPWMARGRRVDPACTRSVLPLHNTPIPARFSPASPPLLLPSPTALPSSLRHSSIFPISLLQPSIPASLATPPPLVTPGQLGCPPPLTLTSQCVTIHHNR